MAEREGFEPPVPLRKHALSKRAHSTTLPPLRVSNRPIKTGPSSVKGWKKGRPFDRVNEEFASLFAATPAAVGPLALPLTLALRLDGPRTPHTSLARRLRFRAGRVTHFTRSPGRFNPRVLSVSDAPALRAGRSGGSQPPGERAPDRRDSTIAKPPGGTTSLPAQSSRFRAFQFLQTPRPPLSPAHAVHRVAHAPRYREWRNAMGPRALPPLHPAPALRIPAALLARDVAQRHGRAPLRPSSRLHFARGRATPRGPLRSIPEVSPSAPPSVRPHAEPSNATPISAPLALQFIGVMPRAARGSPRRRSAHRWKRRSASWINSPQRAG